MERPLGLLLDSDGTLLDGNDARAQAWVDTLAEFGIPSRFDEMRRLIGKGGDKVLPEVAHMDADSTDGKKLGSAAASSTALRCGGWEDEDLREAVAIDDSPAHLTAAYEETPRGANPR